MRAYFYCWVVPMSEMTLTNALAGHTSGRPEATRHNIRGIVHGENQLVLVRADTPGYHRPALCWVSASMTWFARLGPKLIMWFCMPDQRIGTGRPLLFPRAALVRRPVIAVATA